MGGKNEEKVAKKGKLSIYATLIMYALIPLVVGTVIVSAVMIRRSKKEISTMMENYMYSMAEAKGSALYDELVIEGAEAALSTGKLTAFCSDFEITDIPSSYCYVADANATMLWHPTESKIGEPVTNSVVKAACEEMLAGKSVPTAVTSYVFNGATKYASYYVAPDNSFIFCVSADANEVFSGITKLQQYGILIVIGLVVFFTILALLIARIISNPLKDLAKFADVLASGDLTVKVETSTHIHETVGIVDSMEALRLALSKAVGSVKDSGEALGMAVVDVDEKTAYNAESSLRISEAMEEVAETSQSVAESAQTMSEKALELGDNIDRLSTNVENLTDASHEISRVNEEASNYMTTVMKSSTDSVQAVENISDKIAKTNEAVTQISECVQMIEDIASQTNLLSLNASIEAARAGEAGKGFAVVAEEIRKLADDSQASAGEIREIIEKVISISSETVEEAQKVSGIIEKEREYISETQGKFSVLSSSVDQSVMEISSIKNMTVDLSGIKDELTSSISDLGAMSEELGASAEEVSASCSQVAKACEEAQDRTREMRSIQDDLKTAIEVFKI